MRRAVAAAPRALGSPIREPAGQQLYDITTLYLGPVPGTTTDGGRPEEAVMEVLTDVTFLKVLPRAVLRIARQHRTRGTLAAIEADARNLVTLAWAYGGNRAEATVRRISERLGASVNTLKQHMQAEVGDLDLRRCDLHQAVEAARPERPRPEVSSRVPAGTLVLADASWLREVFRELFSNADHHCEADCPRVFLHLDPPDGKPKCILNVSQFDVVLTDEERRRMFEPFYSPKARRLGLGLWSVREILEMMHATIAVDDEFVGGLRYRLTFAPVPIGGDDNG